MKEKTEKTAYIIEGHAFVVPTKDGPRAALERLMGMIRCANIPDLEEAFIQQPSDYAFATANRDAQRMPRKKPGKDDQPLEKSIKGDLPSEVTRVYETSLVYRPLKLSEEPRIYTYHRPAPKQGFAADRMYLLSWMLKEHGKGLGRGELPPIAQIQAVPHMQISVHEDHLEEMAAYAKIKASRTGEVADRRLAHVLEDAMLSRQTEAERKAAPGLMASLRELLQSRDGPEHSKRAA